MIFGFAVICEIKVTQCIKITSIKSPFSSETFSNTLCGSNTYFQYFFVIIIKFDKKSHPLNEKMKQQHWHGLPQVEWNERPGEICMYRTVAGIIIILFCNSPNNSPPDKFRSFFSLSLYSHPSVLQYHSTPISIKFHFSFNFFRRLCRFFALQMELFHDFEKLLPEITFINSFFVTIDRDW